jgi:alpha-amylase
MAEPSSRPRRPRRLHGARWYAAGFASAALLLGMPASAVTSAARSHPAGGNNHGVQREVMANLFEWNWTSVANECTTVLGPKGYGGVQVSPPADSVKRQHLGDGSDTILHPWWEVYQPVDYQLTSRMGGESEFKSMVSTCRKAGVKVYVDAVINHMTGQGDTSYGGKHYTHFDYPDEGWTAADFHHLGDQCNSTTGGIDDFNNLRQVFNCELVGLADLDTGAARVRDKLAAYLNKLIGYGVSGFRVDAGKHVGQTDLDAIYHRLHRTREGTKPYWALEVFGGGPGTLSPQAFTPSGNVLGLDAVKQLRDAFKSYPDAHVGSIAVLKDFGAGSGLTPSSKTLSFVQNHDTERNGDALNYKDGARNILANEYLLASGYGRPQVYSGFAFTTNDDSPPATAGGIITDTDCANGWVCVDRDPGVTALVAFHNQVGQAAQRHWWDDGENVIAFSRGNRGWAAFNNGSSPKQITVQTGLRPGTYCDAVSGGDGGCSGTKVVVTGSGRATVTVPSLGALAIDHTDRQ